MRTIKLLLLLLTISMSANAQSRYENIYAQFEANFIMKYGMMPPNIDWGFGQKRSKVRIIAEDLGETDHFFYNKLVFDVEFLSDSEALITLQAAGGVIPICIGDEDHEAHKLFGHYAEESVNAGSGNSKADPVSFTLKGDFKGMAINIPIKVKGREETEWFELATEKGKVPLKIAVPTTYDWNAVFVNPYEIDFYGESSGESTSKCSTPTISYSNGKIVVSCDTDGATCNTTITNSDIKSYTIKEIKLDATYIIRSYASKQGYNDSETATATLCWIDVEPKAEGIVNGVASVRSYGVMIQASEGFFNISGLEVGTPISVYNTAGQMVGSANASANTTTVNTTLRNGEIGIVKIGDKSVKVLMK